MKKVKPRILSVKHGEKGWFVESNYDPGFSCTGVYWGTKTGAEEDLEYQTPATTDARRVEIMQNWLKRGAE